MSILDLNARQAADRLFADVDPEWIAELAAELGRRLAGGCLQRIMTSWGLSRTDLAVLFGVSRQAVSKWIADGIPAERVPMVADLSAIADLLDHHLKADRIPAVVRRSAPRLDGRSILDMVAAGESSAALGATREMFDFGDLHS